MPEPTGGEQPNGAMDPAVIDDLPFFHALSDLVDAGPRVGGWNEEAAVESTPEGETSTATDNAGGPAANAVLEPAETGDEQSPDATSDATAADAGTDGEGEAGEPAAAETGSDSGETSEGLTRSQRERDEARHERDEARTELERVRRQPAISEADLRTAQDEVFEFLGMAKPKDEQGNETGEEPVFSRLDREAKTTGIEYREDQDRYHELNERGAMAGKLFMLARHVAWQEVGRDLEDESLGIDAAAVERAGGLAGWKTTYRQAIERQLEGRQSADVDAARSETERVRADLQRQLDEANRRLNEQAASHTDEMVRARGRGGPLSPGRPAPATTRIQTAPSTGDLTQDLAESLREMAATR